MMLSNLLRCAFVLLAIVALASVAHGETAVEPAAAPAADRWQLVWSDEFDLPGLPDPTHWDSEEGLLRNDEAQYYTRARSENARVEDGMLVIEARKEAYHGAAYTSASLTTKGKADWTYGRFEVRARLPAGRGVWPAIWTLGSNIQIVGWPRCGEIDLMEFVGFDPGTIHGTVHSEAFNHTKHNQKGAQQALADPHGAWHVYAMEWDAKRIALSIDGAGYFTYDNDGSGGDAWPFTAPQYLILNLAIGGAWGGEKGIDEEIFPQKLVVDWVRVYREKGMMGGGR